MKNLDFYLFDVALLDIANHRFEEKNRLLLFKRINNLAYITIFQFILPFKPKQVQNL